MRRRTVSVAVAYLLLLVATFVADVFLSAVYIAALRRAVSPLPDVVPVFGSGVVKGAYVVGPFYKSVYDPRFNIGYGVYTWGLQITLLNPNPSPAEVVLISYAPASQSTEKVVDLLGTFGLEWVDKSDGVELVYRSPRWFGWAKSYLYMPPHTHAVFWVPLYSNEGVSSKVLACTPAGCTALDYAGGGVEPGQRLPTATWVINPKSKRTEEAVVASTWSYEAYTLVGAWGACVSSYQPPYHMTIWGCGPYVECCSSCPPGCHPHLFEKSYAVCRMERGDMQDYWLGLPMNVVAGYFSTDSGYSFSVPSTTISVGGYSYRLYGFEAQGEFSPPLVSDWLDYDGASCKDRVINITITIRPSNNYGNFSAVWPRSDRIYVYVAAKGGVVGSSRYDPITRYTVVTVQLWYIDRGSVQPVGKPLTATDPVNNSVDLQSSPDKWSIPVGASEIRVVVSIKLTTSDPLKGFCFGTYLGYKYCGSLSGSDIGIRAGFYVELIPSEVLTSG